jgi:GNAT superfamily N-acetyltransferase
VTQNVIIQGLSGHPGLVPLVVSWFEAEWPGWYGAAGEGDAQRDVLRYSSAKGSIPLGLVAFCDGTPCGFGALKNDPIPAGSLLGPWVGAGYVRPDLRGRGIGTLVLRALTREARRLGFPHVYCGTSSAISLLAREGWEQLEVVRHQGVQIAVFRSPA